MSAVYLPVTPELAFGRGYDVATNTAHARAVDFEEPQILGGATGQTIDAEITVITSNSQLAKKLNVTASGSYSGLFSASVEANYLSKQEINKYSTHVMARVRVTNPSLVIGDPRLRPEAKTLLVERGWEAFIKTYGTEYMSAVSTGGSYYGLIHIDSTTKQEQENIKIAVSASGWGAEFKGKLDSEIRKACSNRTITVTVMQHGGGGSGDQVEVSVDDMIQQVKSFPALIAEKPVNEVATFEKYIGTVALPPVIGETPEEKLIREQTLNELGQMYLHYKDLRANIRFIMQHLYDFEQYKTLDDSSLQTIKDGLNKDFENVDQLISDIVKCARACRESATNCKVPSPQPLTIELPELGDQDMTVKQLEENVAKQLMEITKLRQELNNLQSSINVCGKRVGIGTTSPQATLQINEGDQAKNDTFVVGNLTTKGLRIRDNGSAVDIESVGVPLFINAQGQNTIINPWGGTVGVGLTKPQAKLDVNGEIRGKLWYSKEYVLKVKPNVGAPLENRVKMLHSSKCIAFITGIEGSFNTNGEKVGLEIGPDGYWYLVGCSGQSSDEWPVVVKARCAGRP